MADFDVGDFFHYRPSQGDKRPGPIPNAPGGNVASTGDTFSGFYAETVVNFEMNSKKVRKNTGSLTKGIISATRLFYTGSLHYNVFTSRVNAVESDFKERRITEEQAKYRKLKAADKYYSYMHKIGYYTNEQFVYELQNYAEKIGAVNDDSYIFEQVLEESKVSRRR